MIKRPDFTLGLYLSVTLFVLSAAAFALLIGGHVRRLSLPFEPDEIAYGATAPPVIQASIVQDASMNRARLPDVLTTEQLASLLGCNADTVRRRAENGKLFGYRKLDRNAWVADATELHSLSGTSDSHAVRD